MEGSERDVELALIGLVELEPEGVTFKLKPDNVTV